MATRFRAAEQTLQPADHYIVRGCHQAQIADDFAIGQFGNRQVVVPGIFSVDGE